MRRTLIGLCLCLLATPVQADEGMWRPDELPAHSKELLKAGLHVKPSLLSDLSRGPLAAVINLSGCTASFVSPDGLIVTTHHCAAGALQYNSTEERDVFETGYTASDPAHELWAGPAARVRVTLSAEDVTARFDEAVAGAEDDQAAFQAVDTLEKALIAECEKDPSLRCDVAAYDGGARRILIRQLDLRDVRLVHAPPRPIGEYGGDVDNWMWPRHTGDWSFFRAYVGEDGAPAEHAEDNVAYRPKVWLTVSERGVSPGDLVLVAGYPGRTYRYRTGDEVAFTAGSLFPWTRQMLLAMLSGIEGVQAQSTEAKVALTTTHKRLANYEKYLAGLLDGFRKAGLVAERERDEASLRAWVDADAGRKAKLGPALDGVAAVVARQQAHARADQLLSWIFYVPASLKAAGTIQWLAVERGKPDAERDEGWQERDWPQVKASVEQAMRSQVTASDRAMARLLLAEAARLPAEGRIAGIDRFLARFAVAGDTTAVLGGDIHEGAVDRAVASLFDTPSVVLDAAERTRLLDAARTEVEAVDDPLLGFAKALQPDREQARDRAQSIDGAKARWWPGYMAALREKAGRPLYSDANATLRVTWGTVKGYSPREAVEYLPFTTLRGILEKDTGEEPFDAPKAQLDAVRDVDARVAKGEAVRWVDERLGSVPVDFLSTVDTTGGNSGSPTLDADGRLVGLLFDGNYESMASDWVYDKVHNRSIHVEIRYVLWALDRLLGGEALVREMGL